MSRNIYLILCLIFSFLTVHAGDLQRSSVETDIFLLYQGYTINAYNAIGFSDAIHSTISDLPDANPASLSEYNKPGIGMSMEYQTKIDRALDPSSDIGHKRANQYIPQSFAVIYPFKSFQVGLGFYQKYSGEIIFDPIPVITVQNPQGTGEFFEPEFKRYIYSGDIMVSKKFDHVFSAGHQISAGAQLNLDSFKGKEKLSTLEATYSDEAFSWKLGIRYSYQNLFSTAVIFDKGSSFTGNIELNQEILIQDTSSNFQPIQMEYKFKSTTPDRLILGYQLQGIPWLWITGSLNLVYWHQVYGNLDNHLDYSLGFIIKRKEKYSYSIGYYNNDVEREESYYISATNYEANFLSAGFRAKFDSMALYVNIMDSHLSTNVRKQTIGKLGIEYIF